MAKTYVEGVYESLLLNQEQGEEIKKVLIQICGVISAERRDISLEIVLALVVAPVEDTEEELMVIIVDIEKKISEIEGPEKQENLRGTEDLSMIEDITPSRGWNQEEDLK